MKRFVYADNAATTQISNEVFEAMLPWLKDGYGNPSSIYAKGREAGHAIEDARKKIADGLGAQPSEIYFTGCGSESDNWAIKGAAHKLAAKNILSRPRSNTMQCCTPASLWKKTASRSPICRSASMA